MSTDAPQPFNPSAPTPPPMPGYGPFVSPAVPMQMPPVPPDYGQPSPDMQVPEGGPGPYPNQQPGPGYGRVPPAPAYAGAPGYGAPVPMYGQPVGYPMPYAQPVLADWTLRAKGALIDWIAPQIGYMILYYSGLALVGVGANSDSVGSAIAGAILMNAAWIAWLAFMIYDNMILQGKTGQSLGKKWAGIRLIREDNGQIPSTGLNVGRWFAHMIDCMACYIIGWVILPLTQPKKQTISDMICKTIVVVDSR